MPKALQIVSNVRNAKAVWGMDSTQYRASAAVAAEYLTGLEAKSDEVSGSDNMAKTMEKLREVLEGFSLKEP